MRAISISINIEIDYNDYQEIIKDPRAGLYDIYWNGICYSAYAWSLLNLLEKTPIISIPLI